MAPARSYQVEEFLQRKREAMLNKFRAEGQLVSSVSSSCRCTGLSAPFLHSSTAYTFERPSFYTRLILFTTYLQTEPLSRKQVLLH